MYMKKDTRVMPVCLIVTGIIMCLFDYGTVSLSYGDYAWFSDKLISYIDIARIIVEFILIAATCLVLRKLNDRHTALNSAVLAAIYVIGVFALEKIMIALGVRPIIADLASIPLATLDALYAVIIRITNGKSYTLLLLLFQCLTPFLMALAAKKIVENDTGDETKE